MRADDGQKEIIRITIKGESGYCSAEDAYSDRLTITRNSITYDYKPLFESETNAARKWSYRTNSSFFGMLFDSAAEAVDDILHMEDVLFVTDIGVTSFTVTYANKTKDVRDFFLPGDEFQNCFSILKQMVPGCEDVPYVIQTSEDYGE